MNEYRCPKCGKLLFKSDAPTGRVQAFCRPCGALRVVELQARAPIRLTGVAG